MSNLKYLIALLILFGSSVLAQNLWMNELEINFTIQSNTKASACVNANGIHIVYFRSGGIKYALVNSQGEIIRYNKVIEPEGSGADLANVAVVDGNIYAIYYKNNDIKIAKSTDLGNTWNNTFSSYDCINTGCTKIVAYSDVENIHITWSEYRTGAQYYTDVHYVKFTPSSPTTWSDYKRVSDTPTQWTEGGTNPDLVLSAGKVFVNYIGNMNQFPVNRDKSFGNPWNDPEDVPFVELPLGDVVSRVKPLIISNELNTVYVNSWSTFQNHGYLLSHSYKNISSTSWTQNQNYLRTDEIEPNTIFPNVSASTADGKIHLIYWDKDLSMYSYRQINNHSFSDNIANIPLVGYLSNVLIASSNDLYLLKTGNVDLPGKIKFRHYDTNPSAPKNLQITHSANNHPYLTWSANMEPDIDHYIVEKSYQGGWLTLAQTTNTYYEDPYETYCTAPPPQQCQAGHTVIYRVTAVDKHPFSSLPSEVKTYVNGSYPDKEIAQNTELPDKYELEQNYPNPFNPSTSITYNLKNPECVTLKIFDMLGREVAELVNENQAEGKYTVEFSSKDLPSGIYIYKLDAGKFSDMKKMLLMK